MKRYFWQDSEGLVKNELISINNHPLPVNRYFWLQWEKRTNPLPKPDAAIFCNRGNAKQAKGDLDGAIADYDQAIAIQPNFAEYYRNRSVAKKRKGELEAAMADCNKAIQAGNCHTQRRALLAKQPPVVAIRFALSLISLWLHRV